MLAAVTGTTPPRDTPVATTTTVRRRSSPSTSASAVDGTLAQVPGEVSLTELDVPGGGPGTGADVLAKVFSAKADVADADPAPRRRRRRGHRRGRAGRGGQRTCWRCHRPVTLQDAGATRRSTALVIANSRLASAAEPRHRLRPPSCSLSVDLAQRDVQAARTGLQDYQAAISGEARRADRHAHHRSGAPRGRAGQPATRARLLNGDTVLPMPLLARRRSGLTTAGAVLGFAPATGVPPCWWTARWAGSPCTSSDDGEAIPARLLRHLHRTGDAAPTGRRPAS